MNSLNPSNGKREDLFSTAGSRIRAARERTGKSISDVATLLGMTLPAYRDLEDFEGELTQTVSLETFVRIMRVLGLHLRDLFEAEQDRSDTVSLSRLRELVEEARTQRGLSQSELEEAVGWDLSRFFQDPMSAMNWNIDCLIDVARFAHVPSTAVLEWIIEREVN